MQTMHLTMSIAHPYYHHNQHDQHGHHDHHYDHNQHDHGNHEEVGGSSQGNWRLSDQMRAHCRVDPSDLTKRSVTQLVSYLCMYRGALAAKNRAG